MISVEGVVVVRAAAERFLAELSVVVRLGEVRGPWRPGGVRAAHHGTPSSQAGGSEIGIADAAGLPRTNTADDRGAVGLMPMAPRIEPCGDVRNSRTSFKVPAHCTYSFTHGEGALSAVEVDALSRA